MRHPLGFTAITLPLAGRRLRLHLWQHGGSDAPHNHKRPYISLPLLGRFTETLWTVQPGTTHRAAHVEPGSRRTGRRYRNTGQTAALAPATVIRHRPLRAYRRDVTQVHTFGPSGRGPHVTLVWQGRHEQAATIWFREDA